MHGPSVVVARGLSSCGARAYLLRGMWDLPGPGLEPLSPPLAGRFLTTAPPAKSLTQCFKISSMLQHVSILHFFVCVPNNIPL